MKKCKTKKKKYQIGGNVFGVFPNLGQYQDMSNQWDSYWRNPTNNYNNIFNKTIWKNNNIGNYDNYFGNPNSPGYDPNYTIDKNTYNTNVFNNKISDNAEQIKAYELAKSQPGFDPREWEHMNEVYTQYYDNTQIDKSKLPQFVPKDAYNTQQQLGSSIGGIMSGLKYLNSYKPEQQDYLSNGSKGYMYQKGGNVNYTGYTPGTETYNNKYNVIPSNNITMKNTPFPILGIGNNGYIKTMQPGFDYRFGGASYVTELPIRQFGGNTTNMIGNVAANYLQDQYYKRMDMLGANQEFGPMVSTPEFNNKMYEATYNRTNNNVTNSLPNFAPSLSYINNNEISRMKSNSEKNIYRLPGDKTWEYTKEGNTWLARKKGDRKWIDLSIAKNVDYNKVVGILEGDISSSNNTSSKTSVKNKKSSSTIGNKLPDSYSTDNVVDPYNLNSIFGQQYTEPNNFISNNFNNIQRSDIEQGFGFNTPINKLPIKEQSSEFIPNPNAFIPTRIMTPSLQDQEKGVSNMMEGAVVGGLTFRNPYAAAATSIASGVEGALFGTDYVNLGAGLIGGKKLASSAYEKSKPFLKRGKSVLQQQREKVADGSWVSDNLKYFRNEKGQLQSFKDTRGTLQRVLEDNTISSTIKNTFSNYLKTGKKLTKEAYSKLSKKDKNDYDQFFKEENLMQQTINERSKRGVATSFNNFQFGGEVNNNTIIEPRFEEEQELQAEVGEMIVLPKYDITKVKANKLHKHMKDEDVTDILPEGSYILSNDPRMKLGLKTKIGGVAIEDIKLGKSVFEYKENEITAGPKDIYFSTIFKNKKELTPAQLATNIKNIYKTNDLKNDYFATRANEENKQQRAEYLDVLKALSEYKKPKSKQVQKAQYGLQVKDYNLIDPASMYMSKPFGKMDNNINNVMGYGVPKAQLGKLIKYITPGALLAEGYFQNQATKKSNQLSDEENKRFKAAFDNYQQGLNQQTNISNLGALAGFAAAQNIPREGYDNRVEQIGLLNEMDKRNRLSIAAQMYGYNPSQSNSFNRNALSVFGTNAMGYAQNMRARDVEQSNNMRGALNSELRNNNSNYFNSLSNLVSARNADQIRTDYTYNSNKYNAMVTGINDLTGTYSNNIGLKDNFNLYRYNNEEALRRQQNLRLEQMRNKATSEVEGVTGAIGDLGLMAATGGFSGFTGGTKTNQNVNNNLGNQNPYGYDPLLGRGYSLPQDGANPYGYNPYTNMGINFGQTNPYSTNTVVPGFSRKFNIPGLF